MNRVNRLNAEALVVPHVPQQGKTGENKRTEQKYNNIICAMYGMVWYIVCGKT